MSCICLSLQLFRRRRRHRGGAAGRKSCELLAAQSVNYYYPAGGGGGGGGGSRGGKKRPSLTYGGWGGGQQFSASLQVWKRGPAHIYMMGGGVAPWPRPHAWSPPPPPKSHPQCIGWRAKPPLLPGEQEVGGGGANQSERGELICLMRCSNNSRFDRRLGHRDRRPLVQTAGRR